MSRRVVVALAVTCVAIGGFVVARSFDDSSTSAPATEVSTASRPEWDYVIPAGTGDRLAAGEVIDILPSMLHVRVGESIRIRNLDDTSFTIGPWYVGPGETMQQRFASPGTFEGDCNLQASGAIHVIVSET